MGRPARNGGKPVIVPTLIGQGSSHLWSTEHEERALFRGDIGYPLGPLEEWVEEGGQSAANTEGSGSERAFLSQAELDLFSKVEQRYILDLGGLHHHGGRCFEHLQWRRRRSATCV